MLIIAIIGRTVEKLLLGLFFHENSPAAPLELNVENIDISVLFQLLRQIDQ
jgi:hypothetical protein